MIAAVIQKGSTVYVYDERNHQLSTRSISSSAKVLGYTGSTYSVQNGHTLYVFDEKSHQLSSRSV